MGPQVGSALMRLSEIRDRKIRSLDGESLGRVHEVHCERGKIIALVAGPGSFVERWTGKWHGRRSPWECVVKVEREAIIVTPDPPQRKPKTSAARTPRGTRRPTAPRSKR